MFSGLDEFQNQSVKLEELFHVAGSSTIVR